MRTRSSGPVVEPSSTPRRHRKQKCSKQQVNLTVVEEKPVVTMADTRTMAELLRAPTEGTVEAIVVPPIPAEHFELKHSLLNLVTSKQFFEFEKEDPHAHIPRIWLEKEPPRSIETWDDLVSKFINKFFPPSKTTNLRNKISNFQQHFDEPFHETWDRFKDLLRVCPRHGFTKLHQLDTFYNSLNPSDQDSLNSAAGVSTNTSTSGLSPDVVVLTDVVKALLLKNTTPPPASVKAVEESCVTCGGPHPYYHFPTTNANASGYQDNIQAYVSAAAENYNQGNAGYRPLRVAHQSRPPGFPPVQNNQNRGNNYTPGNSTYRAPTPPIAPSNELANYMKVNETHMRSMQNQIDIMKTELRNEFQATMLQQNNKLENMLSNYFQNKPPSSSSGPIPSNTVNNLKSDLKAITTQSGVSYDGPPIPPHFSPSPKVVEKELEVTKDPAQPSTENIQPLDVQPQARTSEPVYAPKPKPNIPYPSRLTNQKLRERDDHQMKKFLQIFQSFHFDISFSDALLYMPKFASTFKNLLSHKEKLFEVATNTSVNENCSAVILKKLPEKLGVPGKFLIPCNFSNIPECLALADLGASINLMPLSIWRKLSLPELNPTQMILELVDRSTTRPTGIAEDVFVRVGKFHFLADFVVVDYDVDPRVPLILGRPFLRTARALIDVYSEELTLQVGDEAITFKVACEEYSQEVLGFFRNFECGNPTPASEPIIARSSPSLTSFEGDCDFFFKKFERFTSVPEFETFRFDPEEENTDVSLPEYECFYSEGDNRLLEKFLNEDPSSPLPPKEIKTKELKSIKSSIDEPSELELKDKTFYSGNLIAAEASSL
nr:hypothetical protein [Tanacetum cinerariifolium]